MDGGHGLARGGAGCSCPDDAISGGLISDGDGVGGAGWCCAEPVRAEIFLRNRIGIVGRIVLSEPVTTFKFEAFCWLSLSRIIRRQRAAFTAWAFGMVPCRS